MNWNFYPIEQLERLAPSWDAINDAAAGLPFLQSHFLLPLCATFGNRELKIALCENTDGPLAMAILRLRAPHQWQTFQPSQWPVGAWIQRPDVQIQPLLASLLKALPGFALSLGITQQDPDFLTRPVDSDCLATLDYIRTARITVHGSFEQYWEARGKNLKHNMKRQRSKLEKDGIKTSLEIVTGADDIVQAIVDYGQLESAGWKARGGTAIHPENAQGQFYRTMLENFCRQGRGRVYRYRFNDRIVAVDLCIEANASLIILKTTHDESIKTCSPALLMRQEAFSKLFDEQRIKRIEFYGKLMEWHTRWSDEVRTMYHVNYYRWPLLHSVHRMLGKSAAEPLPAAAPAPASTAQMSKYAAYKWHLVPASEFDKYAQSWQLLSHDLLPVLDPIFIRTLISVFGRGDELLAIYCNGESVAALGVLSRKGRWNWETFQPAQAPLGPWLHRSDLSWEMLLPELMAILPGHPLVLGITQKSSLQFPRPPSHGHIRAMEYVSTARILVNRTFDEYWSARDGNVRHQIERRLKRLRESGTEPRLEAVTDPAAIHAAINEFGYLESAGWKGRSGTAIHAENVQGEFYRRLFQEFCARGNGVVYRYLFNETTVAMELCIDGAGARIMLKTAYNEAYKSYAPGFLMRHAIFKQVFDNRQVTRICFLGKLQPWQTKWMDEAYPLYHVNAYRWPWLAKVSNVFDVARRGNLSKA